MRKTMIAVLLCALFAPAFAMAGEWTGWITDEQCAAKGAKAEHADCAKKCHENGAKLVFYNTGDEKVYTLDNQELAAKHIGHEVTVKGDAKDNAIKVASIEAKGGHADHAGHSHH
jgi:ribonuclease HII